MKKNISLSRSLSLLSLVCSYLFLYLPIFVLVFFSFNTKRFPAAWDQFTLYWYEELFRSSELWISFGHSLLIASMTTCLSLTMGISLLFFHSQGGKIKKYIPLFYGNILLPETMIAISLLTYFSLFQIPLGLLTLITAHSVFALGFVIPILHTRYKQIDAKLYEASLVLGASKEQTFFKITLPMLKPTLTTIGCFVFILSFDDFIFSYFCSGTKVKTLSLYLLSMLRLGITPIINALFTLLFLLSALLLFFFLLPKISTKRRGND